jgi:multiple sugar transport system substrate-binding protein
VTPPLRAIGWDHPRCRLPMLACTSAWRHRTGVEIAWSWRSLEAFGDQPLEELAPGYDILVIDHPFCGTAAAAGCLHPLDALLARDELDTLARDAVGLTHASYCFAGRQWGLATDAACQVSALRDDLLEAAAPATWDGVLALARSAPGRVAMPLAPAHAASSFLTLCANHGEPAAGARLVRREIGIHALSILVELHRLGPADATAWEPPDVLERLAGSDELTYVPLTYAFVTYSDRVRFLDIPSAGHGPVGAVLGGAGLAVSASSSRPAEAAAFAAWASGAQAQRTVVARFGGQPGNRAAWLDAELDRVAGGFYSGTLATIEAAWVRPRAAWWPPFQLDSGRLLSAALRNGTAPADIYDQLDALYRDRSRRAA